MTTTDVDTVATDGDLEDLLGQKTLAELTPDSWGGSAKNARAEAFERVLTALAAKNPPVYEHDLADLSELKRVVVIGAAAELYGESMHSDGDAFHLQHRRYEKRFAATLQALSVTTQGGLRGGGLKSISIERR